MFSRRIWDALFAAAFLTSITVPMVIAFVPRWSDTAWIEDVEKRKPAPFPSLSGQRDVLRKLPSDFEAFFNDNVGFRTALIQFRNRVDLRFFRKSPAAKVVLGEGDWLFYNDKPSDDEFLGLAPFKPAELNRLRLAIEKRQAWLAARGITYIFLIAPNKQSIYPEKLPVHLQGDHGATRTIQFLEYMRGSPAESSVVFPSDALSAAKADGELYYHRDTHWNYHGGYTAYRAAVDRLDHISSGGVAPLALAWDDISDSNAPNGPAGGDLANMLHVEPGTTAPAKVVPVIGRPTCGVPAAPAAIEGVSPGTWPDNAWTCASDSRAQRLLLFHDSFGYGMLPFYAATFSYFRDAPRRPTFDEIVKFVEIDHPTVVIEEHVERYFEAPELQP